MLSLELNIGPSLRLDFDYDVLGFLFIPTPVSRAHNFNTD